MAAGPLGINLAESMGYVDLMKETRGWTPLNGSTSALDTNGWPLTDAQNIVLDERVNQSADPNAVQPDIGGTYHLSFQGRATISPDWLQNYTVVNQVYNAATNTTTADLDVTHNSLAMLYLDMKNTVNPASSTGAGVTNVKLIQPGYAANTTQVFTNNMVNALAPIGTIRYMNVDGANSYGPTLDASGKLVPLQWSQRKLPSASSQTSGPGAPGESWEYMIALANATNTDMWINIPGPASNDYVTQLANLIKNGDTVAGVHYAGLNPNLKVNVELSNEVWGGIYAPYAYTLEAAKEEVAAGKSPLNNDGSTDPNFWLQRYYLEREMEVTNIFRGVFGADPTYSKVRPVLGWQEQNYWFYTDTFPWFEKTFGAPNQFFYGMGNANYENPTDFSTVDNLINSLIAGIPQQSTQISVFTTIANYYGLKNMAYEGSPGTGGAPTAAQQQVSLAASRDPRMENVFLRDYTAWYAAGGDLAVMFDGPFDNFTPGSQSGLAEVSEEADPSASPKYRGIVDVSQATPPAITAGIHVSPSSPTPLSVTSDSLYQSFFYPSIGKTNHWLLNVPTAGNYALSLQTGSGPGSGKVVVSLSDTTQVGTFSLGGAGTYPVGTLALHAGLNTLAITALNNFLTESLTLTPVSGPALSDPSFESAPLSPGYYGFAYDPTGTPWTFTGQSGVTGNGSAFNGANPNAPQGQQVAFVQNQGTISQSVANWAAGNYAISFSTAQRAGYATQTFQVLVDGASVGTFTPSGTSYQTMATSSFAVSAGSHTIQFKGLDPTGGDATAFLDGVTITQAASVAAPSPSDSGFEAATLSDSPFAYDPTGTPWTFAGQSGVSGNGSGFTAGNAVAPQGKQVAFVQNQGVISQSVSNWAAGSYAIAFQLAQRANYGSTQTLQVLVDGAVVGTFTPTPGSYQLVKTGSFAVSAGSHTISFKGLNASGDATAFLDGVTITQAASVAAPSPSDSGFEAATIRGTGYSDLAYDPTGTPWTFAGQSGVSGNGSGFTAGNAGAPQGKQVAFVQNQGVISQSVSNWAAGSYAIAFQLAQRANYGSTQTLQVLVDGAVVGTFTPTPGSYQLVKTGSFSVSAGSHTISFKGLNASGDATAFLDNVSVVPQ